MREQRKFDKAFKEQVAIRVISGEITASAMADEIGVHHTTWSTTNHEEPSCKPKKSQQGSSGPDYESKYELQTSYIFIPRKVGYTWPV